MVKQAQTTLRPEQPRVSTYPLGVQKSDLDERARHVREPMPQCAGVPSRRVRTADIGAFARALLSRCAAHPLARRGDERDTATQSKVLSPEAVR